MILFFDRCFGKRLPQALRDIDLPCSVVGYFDKYQEEHNGPALPDDVWLRDAGKHGWIVVTMDDKWHHELVHSEAIITYQVGCFVLSGSQDPLWKRVKIVLDAFPRIQEIVATDSRPFLYRVDKHGRVTAKHLVRPA